MKKPIVSLLLLAVLCWFVLPGCKKDIQTASEKNLSAVDAYTKLPDNASKELKGIAANIRSTEEQTPFLDEFAKANGYPVWDKAISNGDPQMSLFLIPLVDPVSNEVLSYIVACQKKDGLSYGFSTYNKEAMLSAMRTDKQEAKNIEPMLAPFAMFENTINHKKESTFWGDRAYHFSGASVVTGQAAQKLVKRTGRSDVKTNFAQESGGGGICNLFFYSLIAIVYSDGTWDLIQIEVDPCGGFFFSWFSGINPPIAPNPGNTGPATPPTGLAPHRMTPWLPSSGVFNRPVPVLGWGSVNPHNGIGMAADLYDPELEEADNDPANTVDESSPDNVLVSIPSQIALTGDDVWVVFGSTSYGGSADQPVRKKLLDALVAALNTVNANGQVINTLNIKVTSNAFLNDPYSNHNKKLAIDITGIDGILIGNSGASAQALALQNALENTAGRHENYGPGFQSLDGVQRTPWGFDNRIHFSVTGH